MNFRRYGLLSVAFLVSVSMYSCTKDEDKTPEIEKPVCNIMGTYTGTSQTKLGTSPMTYIFKEHNFAVGSKKNIDPIVTWGGYSNTCDSVFINVYYSENKNYYLLKGKLSADLKTISGSGQNLNDPSDTQTFTISK